MAILPQPDRLAPIVSSYIVWILILSVPMFLAAAVLAYGGITAMRGGNTPLIRLLGAVVLAGAILLAMVALLIIFLERLANTTGWD